MTASEKQHVLAVRAVLQSQLDPGLNLSGGQSCGFTICWVEWVSEGLTGSFYPHQPSATFQTYEHNRRRSTPALEVPERVEMYPFPQGLQLKAFRKQHHRQLFVKCL